MTFEGVKSVPLVVAFIVLTVFSRVFGAIIEDQHIQLTFNEETGGIASIVNKDTGHDFISSEAKKLRLWELVLKTSSSNEVRVSSDRCRRPLIRETKGRVDLSWRGISVQGASGDNDVRVTCAIEKSDHLAHLRIDVDNNSDASLISTVFPVVANLGK